MILSFLLAAALATPVRAQLTGGASSELVISSATAELLNDQVLVTGVNFTPDAEIWLADSSSRCSAHRTRSSSPHFLRPSRRRPAATP